MDYFNLGLITETPIAFYLLQCKRAKAVEVFVKHFDVEFYYFLRRARGKKVTLFFRDVAAERSWFLRSYAPDRVISEDLLNSHINRICSYVNFNPDLDYETN